MFAIVQLFELFLGFTGFKAGISFVGGAKPLKEGTFSSLERAVMVVVAATSAHRKVWCDLSLFVWDH